MVAIGNFFFKYRNIIFILFYAALFVPSPALFSEEVFGANYYWWPIVLGLIITISGQAIRGATIGLAYIVRGGKGKLILDMKWQEAQQFLEIISSCCLELVFSPILFFM